MSNELSFIVENITGLPPREIARGKQACHHCKERFENGDEVIFNASRKANRSENYEEENYIIPRVYHRHHHGESGQYFELDRNLDEHNVLITAVLEKTGYDYGRDKVERFEMDYEPDVEEDALTFGQVMILEYSSPLSAGPEN